MGKSVSEYVKACHFFPNSRGHKPYSFPLIELPAAAHAQSVTYTVNGEGLDMRHQVFVVRLVHTHTVVTKPFSTCVQESLGSRLII